jgi:hypothetical protein
MCVTTNFAAFADENDPEFRECAAIDESADRLACYDRLMGRGTEPGIDNSAASVPATTVPSDSTSIAASSTVTLESGPVSNSTDTLEQPPDDFTAIVTGVSERTLGQHVVLLDNGQVWQEEFASNYFAVEVGDTVTIKKRFFGGYRLIAESGKGYNVEMVR